MRFFCALHCALLRISGRLFAMLYIVTMSMSMRSRWKLVGQAPDMKVAQGSKRTERLRLVADVRLQATLDALDEGRRFVDFPWHDWNA